MATFSHPNTISSCKFLIDEGSYVRVSIVLFLKTLLHLTFPKKLLFQSISYHASFINILTTLGAVFHDQKLTDLPISSTVSFQQLGVASSSSMHMLCGTMHAGVIVWVVFFLPSHFLINTLQRPLILPYSPSVTILALLSR